MMAILTAIWNARGLVPWVLVVAAVAGALWYHGQYESCQASIAQEAAKAEAAVAAYKASDATATRALEQHTATITAAIEQQASDTRVALAKVQSVAACNKTPAAAAFDASMGKR